MINKNDGFTLLEIVISIAALSIISVFILRMFLASSNLNDRAKDTDMAVNQSITEIEKLKTHSSLSDYLETNAPGAIAENGDTLSINFYYDNDWKYIIHPGGTVPGTARYRLKMDIAVGEESMPRPGDITAGILCGINVDVTDMSLRDDAPALASLQTKKYFPNGFEEGGL